MAKKKINPRAVSDIDKRVGERIRAQRMLLKLSQEDLAEKLGVTFQQLQKYEKGANRLSSSRLLQLAEALKTDVGHLLGTKVSNKTTSKPDEMAVITDMLSTLDGMRIAKAFVAIPKGVRRDTLVDLLEIVAKV